MSKRAKLLMVSLVATGLLVFSFAGIAQADGPNDADDCPCGLGGPYGLGATHSEAVSELLGLTHEEIETQRHEGKSLVEIAAAQGVSEDALVEAIMAVKKEAIQQRVEAGILTQEKANLMLQQMEQRTHQTVNRTSVGPPEWSGGSGNGNGNGNGRGAYRGKMGNGNGQGAGMPSWPRWGRGSR